MIVTAAFNIVTADFGKQPEIGHHQVNAAVTIARNEWSRWIETTGHGDPKYAIA